MSAPSPKHKQADASNWVRVLPATAVSVRVSFYAATAQQLAPAHPVVQVWGGRGSVWDAEGRVCLQAWALLA